MTKLKALKIVSIVLAANLTFVLYNNCTGFKGSNSAETSSASPTMMSSVAPCGRYPDGGPCASIPSNFTVSDFLRPAWNTGAIPPDEGASDPVGAFRMVCNASHEAYDDPIVFPGKPGASHLHQFYGNTMANAFSTYESLRTTGKSTCNGPLNRSAYWIPAMMNGKGQVVRPDFVTIYYKRYPKDSPLCLQQSTGGCVDLPRGLRMVFGFNFKTQAIDPGSAQIFRCAGVNLPDVAYPTMTAAAKVCTVGSRLNLSISSPNCWDGVHLDSADHRSHLAYMVNHWDPVKGSYNQCDDQHPYIIPQISVSPMYTVDADLDNSGVYTAGVTQTWSLSSDPMGTKKEPGETFHADWFGAWDDDIMKTWTDNCINKHLSCTAGDLGNGTQMTFFDGFSTDPANPHVVAPPPAPPTDMSTMTH